MLIQRLATVSVAIASVTVLWRSRLFQVLAFAAAGLRRDRDGAGPNGTTEPFARVQPDATAGPLNRNLLITYHPEYHNFDSRMAIQSLASITQLGAGWLRTDIRWRLLLPDGETVNPIAMSWYGKFLGAAQRAGLSNMVVLSSPPKVLGRMAGSAKLDRWNRFVAIVGAELGDCFDAVQLMNEPNNPVYGFLSRDETVDAIKKGASIFHTIGSRKKTVAVNISMEIWGWRDYLAEVLDRTGGAIDVIGLDHYPWTWSIGFQERWTEILSVATNIASANSSSNWFQRRLAIMETGFSTNAPFRREAHQAQYFAHLHSTILHLKETLRETAPLLGIYELCDANTFAGLDPEAHFGVMTTELKPKLAFSEIKKLRAVL